MNNIHKPVIMFTKQKGGVGNSTATITVATKLAKIRRILLIDMDLTRSDCAVMLGLDKGPDLYRLFTEGVFEPAQTSNPNLDILRGDISSTWLGRILADRTIEEIQDTLIGIMEDYDLVIIDASPDTSSLRNAAAGITNLMVLTTSTDATGHDELFQLAEKCLKAYKPFVIAPTLIRTNSVDAKAAMAKIRGKYPQQTADDIPYREGVRAAARKHETIWDYAQHPHQDHVIGMNQVVAGYNALISKMMEQGGDILTPIF